MTSVLRRNVMSEQAARRLVWACGFSLHAACTTLVLKALPEFGLAASVGLVAAVALAWVVMAAHFRTMVAE